MSFGEPKEEEKVCCFIKYVFKICMFLLWYVLFAHWAFHWSPDLGRMSACPSAGGVGGSFGFIFVSYKLGALAVHP